MGNAFMDFFFIAAHIVKGIYKRNDYRLLPGNLALVYQEESYLNFWNIAQDMFWKEFHFFFKILSLSWHLLTRRIKNEI